MFATSLRYLLTAGAGLLLSLGLLPPATVAAPAPHAPRPAVHSGHPAPRPAAPVVHTARPGVVHPVASRPVIYAGRPGYSAYRYYPYSGYHRYHPYGYPYYRGYYSWYRGYYPYYVPYAVPYEVPYYIPYTPSPVIVTPSVVYPTPTSPSIGSEAAVTTCGIEVLLPNPEAVVSVDGRRIEGTGAHRWLVTPALEPGKDYSYRLTATWSENGLPRSETRSVLVRAGTTVVVDFTTPAPATGE